MMSQALATLPDRKRHLLPAALLATVLLSAIIGAMIENRARILRDGTEIVLRAQPIDPRDLLRGHYVALAFDIAQFEGPLVEAFAKTLDEDNAKVMDVYVTLAPDANGIAQATGISRIRPSEGLFIKGQTLYAHRQITFLPIDFGLSRFYADPARAQMLEARMRQGEVTEIVVAVNDAGTGQIKALRQAGEQILVETPY